MAPDRDIPRRETGELGSEKFLQMWPMAAALGSDQGTIGRLHALLADQGFDDSRITEGLRRGAAAAEVLGKLGMDGESLLAATLLPLAETGKLDAAWVEKWIGGAVPPLIEGACRIASLKDLRKTASEAVQAHRLRQLLLTIAEDPRVVVISLAHQVCTLRAAINAPATTRRELGQETFEVFAPLANRLGVWQLKQELEDLAFHYLDPDNYQRIADWLDQQHSDREQYIARVIAQLERELDNAGIRAEISGRPKHIYSIWSKMRAKGLDLHGVFDILGFRILVAELSECYTALAVVHGLWEPILDEYDDYIAKPKPNGYQSLHSAVTGLEGATIEVQIRTQTMHRHAELGIAAHWHYKEKLPTRIAWSRGFLGNGEVSEGGTDLIERFKRVAFHQRIYLLTPEGHVIDLPTGATPVDFAYAVHTDVGHHCRGAKVDGAMAPLTQRLASGQQVEILTARDGHPSRDWLNPNLGYLTTPSARAKVRRWFKEQDYELHLAQGRALLERERRRLGLTEINITDLAKAFDKHAEELLAALGSGALGPAQLSQALSAQLPPKPLAAPTRASQKRPGTRGNLLVEGSRSVLHKMAGCCRPVPGEPIGGYVTALGQGVSVHRRDCPNLKELAAQRPEKMVAVSWDAAVAGTYSVEIVVSARDRRGLLRDVSDALTNEKINITGVNTRSEPSSGTAQMRFTIEVGGTEQLEQVLSRIARLQGVHYARRKT